MYLEKWYADIVEDGQVQVHYLANLQFGPLTLGYSACLGGSRARTTRMGIHRLPTPTLQGNVLRWPVCGNNRALTWRGACLRPQRLWEDGARLLTWEPIVLNGRTFTDSGLPAHGYVERLTLNFAPWHLGLKRLKWGRFCGQEHSLVWIEWQGAISKKLVLLDGRAETLLTFGRNEIQTESSRLILGKPSEIVSEPLKTGALAGVARCPLFGAQRFLAGIETKWLADSVLALHGEVADRGFSVYEEVVWP